MALRRTIRLILLIVISAYATAGLSNFDDLSLSAESFWNGSDQTGDFVSGSATFNNNYDASWGSWDGWAYSNKSQTDPVEKGTDGQYTAMTGSAQSGFNYGIGFIGFTENPSITLNTAGNISGIYVTNNNYAYYSMLEGDAFSKQFGGAGGDDEDWFNLTIEGFDTGGLSTGTVDFYLADYRFADNAQDYIVDTWEYVNLISLGTVKSLQFTLSSSDNGDWGMNTPAYFAMDTVIPEPMTIALLGLGGLMLRKKKV